MEFPPSRTKGGKQVYKPEGSGLYTAEEVEELLKDAFEEGIYKNPTTFISDFQIANCFGVPAVKDTFNRAFNEWKDHIVYLTGLAVAMNTFSWIFYEKKNEELSKLYAGFYYICRDYAYSDGNFTEAEARYYFKCTD